MISDFVRPMGVPPPRDPRRVPPFSNTPIKPQDSARPDDRAVSPDPIRGNNIDLKA